MPPEPAPSEPSLAPLNTCPDCGGILEPANPAWQAFVQSMQTDGADPPRPPAGSWRCLICGYHKPLAP